MFQIVSKRMRPVISGKLSVCGKKWYFFRKEAKQVISLEVLGYCFVMIFHFINQYHIPPEILENIFRRCDQESLCDLTCCSQNCYELVMPILRETINISGAPLENFQQKFTKDLTFDLQRMERNQDYRDVARGFVSKRLFILEFISIPLQFGQTIWFRFDTCVNQSIILRIYILIWL